MPVAERTPSHRSLSIAKSKQQQDEKGCFVTGNSDNGGRPKGPRNQLGEAFVADIHIDWHANSGDVIKTRRENRSQDYLKVVASILLKDVNMNVSPYERMNDEELEAEIMKHMSDLGYLKDDAPGEGSVSTEH